MKKFYKIDCSLYSDDDLKLELFGKNNNGLDYFQTNSGLFEIANHGTVLIKSIDKLSLDNQKLLLSVILDDKYDVRVIVTSNKDLKNLVSSNKFNSDLYDVLGIFVLKLPLLKDRVEDIAPLVKYYINYYNLVFNLDVKGMEEDAIAMFSKMNWQGNVRELENILSKMMINLSYKTKIITKQNFNILERKSEDIFIDQRLNDIMHDSYTLDEVVADIEKKYIFMCLEKNDGDKVKTAEELGISLRTLYNKYNNYIRERGK